MRQEAASSDNPSAMETEQHEFRAIRSVICCAVGILYWCKFLFPQDLEIFRNMLVTVCCSQETASIETCNLLLLVEIQTSKSAVDGE